MFQWLAGIITAPLFRTALDAYKAKLDSGNTKDRIAADLAARELELQRREAELGTEYKRALIGKWYEPVQLLGYIMVLYVGKVVVYDKVLAWGVTDPITGSVGEWAGAIIMFLIGKRGVENVARILKRG